MPQAIIGFLVALPQLLKMINDFAVWLNKVSGGDPAGFISKAAPVFYQLTTAKTVEDHQNAAKNISDLLRNLPVK